MIKHKLIKVGLFCLGVLPMGVCGFVGVLIIFSVPSSVESTWEAQRIAAFFLVVFTALCVIAGWALMWLVIGTDRVEDDVKAFGEESIRRIKMNNRMKPGFLVIVSRRNE